MKASRIYLFCTVLLSSICLGANAPLPALGAHIASVASGGYWEQGNSHGIYRIVVSDFGFDHVASQVVAQRISEPNEETGEPKVISQQILVEPFAFNFDPPKLEPSTKGLTVTLSGVLVHELTTKVSCVFQLLPDGSIKNVQPCR